MISCTDSVVRPTLIPQNLPHESIGHTPVAVHVLTHLVSSHVLSGLCKITGYEILRHGTSWTNYTAIIGEGADPRRGGLTTELAERHQTSTSYINRPDGTWGTKTVQTIREAPSHIATKARNHFYVFRDTELGVREDGCRALSPLMSSIGKIVGPIMHSFLAYQAEYVRDHQEQMGVICSIIALVKAIFTPKLNFIYSLEEIHGADSKPAMFEKDPDYGEESAYRTQHTLPSNRIGLAGFLTHLDMNHAKEHIMTHPLRVVHGIAQLCLGIFLTIIPGLGIIT